MNELARFMVKVSPEPNTGCWLWLGAPSTRNGYGRFWNLTGSAEVAHRAAWRLLVAPLGDQRVLHRCDNPACVNPGHLFLGTQLDNIRDRDAKGRGTTTAANAASTAKWHARTRCSRGHPFTPENTIISHNAAGYRKRCRACGREYRRAARAKARRPAQARPVTRETEPT